MIAYMYPLKYQDTFKWLSAKMSRTLAVSFLSSFSAAFGDGGFFSLLCYSPVEWLSSAMYCMWREWRIMHTMAEEAQAASLLCGSVL